MAASAPSDRRIKGDSKAGFASLTVFLSAALLEILFTSITLFNVSALPDGSGTAFPLVRNAAIILFLGQISHGAGILVAVPGILGRKHKRRLAALGAVVNLIPMFLFWFG
jgi:hypothetical protein